MGRALLIPLLVALPSIGGALVMTRSLLHHVAQATIAEAHAELSEHMRSALLNRDVERAHAAIAGGFDPNTPLEFRAPGEYGPTIVTGALVIAATQRDDNTVSMLLNYGAKPEAGWHEAAAAAARERGEEGLARLIEDPIP